MKLKTTLLTLAIIIATTFLTTAQTSDMGFSFQGYAIDPDGKAMGGTAVTVQFTIGTFNEEHFVTTDAFGVFHAIVGNSSTIKKEAFSKLDFTKKGTIYSLKVEVKKTSGGMYTTISNEPMNAVPYARYAFNGVPVGTIIAYGGDKNNIPEGWLLCDGASVLQDDYLQLHSVIGSAWGTSGSSFNLPDLRGRFLRGVADGTTNDPDAAARIAINAGGNDGDNVGTLQGDDNKEHNHTLTDPEHTHNYRDVYHTQQNGSVVTGSDRGTNRSTDWDINRGHDFERTSRSSSTGISIAASGSAETRPKNAAVYYIIKY